MDGPVITSGGGSHDSRGLLLFLGGILATIALVVGIVLLWPEDDDQDVAAVDATTATTDAGTGTTSSDGGSSDPDPETTEGSPTTAAPVHLFTGGASDALLDLREAAGNPTQVIEVAIYDTYAFLAYRDPANPGNLDRRLWRDGEVDEPSPNPIDDRVDADTEPKLFDVAALDLAQLSQLTGDAVSRFSIEVEVSHVIINRFLPFDERVLIRVYASPTDGRSGGGYVQYTLAGELVKVVQ